MVITVIHATKGCDLDESASTFTTALPAANFKSKVTCIGYVTLASPHTVDGRPTLDLDFLALIRSEGSGIHKGT